MLYWNNPYYFYQANQQKANCKIYSLTQYGLNVNGCNWNILASNDDKTVAHFWLGVHTEYYRKRQMKEKLIDGKAPDVSQTSG